MPGLKNCKIILRQICGFCAQEFEFLSIEQETRPKKAISNKRVWKTSTCLLVFQTRLLEIAFLGLVSCSMDRNSNSCAFVVAVLYRP